VHDEGDVVAQLPEHQCLVHGHRDRREHADPPVAHLPTVAVRAVDDAELDLELVAGDAAEFDTHTPHWFGCANAKPVELLVLFGPQGERVHVRAAPRQAPAAVAR